MWAPRRRRRRVPSEHVVVQVHAPAMDLPLVMRSSPIVRVAHNDPGNLAASEGGTRWRYSARLLHASERLAFRRAARCRLRRPQHISAIPSDEPDATAHMAYLPNGVDTDQFRLARASSAAPRADASPRSWASTQGAVAALRRAPRPPEGSGPAVDVFVMRTDERLTSAQLIVVARDGPLREQTSERAKSAGLEGLSSGFPGSRASSTATCPT